MNNDTVRVVAVDVDGTLAGADHRVSRRTMRVLTALEEKGVAPVIITGRTETAALSIAHEAGLTAAIISCNGAIVTDPVSEHRLRETTFARTVIADLIEWSEGYPDVELFLWTAERMHAERRTPAAELLEAINLEGLILGSFGNINQQSVVKVMIGGTAADLDQVADELAGRFDFMHRSLDAFFEGSAPGASKRESLKVVLDGLGVTLEECLGIADGDTDVGWLSDIGQAIAVPNARPSVLAIADDVIGHHADEAVAKFLEGRFNLL